jgi:hypothetical protein
MKLHFGGRGRNKTQRPDLALTPQIVLLELGWCGDMTLRICRAGEEPER